MINLIIVSLLIFIVAVVMTMVGKGGGNFYVVILVIASLPMHEAATIGQFILFTASLSALLIFQKGKFLSWKLALVIGGITALAALGGGYFSHLFSGFQLKVVFSIMLVIAGTVMLIPVKKHKEPDGQPQPGNLRIYSGESIYSINLWIALPVTLVTGFASGMVGVSGGSFLVPLMVLACGVPMHIAVGTASTVIAATSLMGFTGHALQGDFNLAWGLPLALITIIGGILGGTFSIKTKPKHLKQLFAYTNWLAAIFMIYNALHTKGVI
jgi:uncharacterized membrane protein YfcA